MTTLGKPVKLRFARLIVIAGICGMLLVACHSVHDIRPEREVHWSVHPEVTMPLSQAIVAGMRTMLADLLISPVWFEGMDLSVMADGEELLRARISGFRLQPESGTGLQANWNIHMATGKSLEHLKRFSVSNIADSMPLEIRTDTTGHDLLNLNIYETTARLPLTGERVPATVKIIYWRDLKAKDPIIVLDVPLTGLHTEQFSDSF